MKRTRSQVSGTPPRPDGTSAFFAIADEEGEDTPTAAPSSPSRSGSPLPRKRAKRPARPIADPSQYAHLGDDPLPDYLDDGLSVLLCGINPGVKSAQLGLHYANPTNHFWRCLAESGLTPRLLHPSEGPKLPLFGLGSTNLVERPSAEMSEISTSEMTARVPTLLRKVVRYRPRILACVGMKICEVILRYLHNQVPAVGRRKAMPKVKIGLQPCTFIIPDPAGEGTDHITYFWCLPSTSARVVEYQLTDKIKIWRQLKEDVERLAEVGLDLPDGYTTYTASLLPPEPPAAGFMPSVKYKLTLL
ncbi:mismatch-specific DNA-glycosylase [Rhodotorula paludigena]|uniref:mismatch-specific DNA-glycosylase n=1 Tax=Rhodotorula paludigena TaxID=86838 RepID=UPI00317C84BF